MRETKKTRKIGYWANAPISYYWKRRKKIQQKQVGFLQCLLFHLLLMLAKLPMLMALSVSSRANFFFFEAAWFNSEILYAIFPLSLPFLSSHQTLLCIKLVDRKYKNLTCTSLIRWPPSVLLTQSIYLSSFSEQSLRAKVWEYYA